MLSMQDFDEYQIHLFKEFEEFRIPYDGVAYPPYHKGLYLEEYFYKQFLLNGKRTRQYLIPVFWTNCYLSGTIKGLQDKLNKLDPDREYFCISQHDDAIKEILPPRTIHFNAGGNKDGIPIPLVCSPIFYPEAEKKVFCSFVGSVTHPIRAKISKQLCSETGFEIYNKLWSGKVSDSDKDAFLRKTSESIFSLCPRGYGASSFRFYEALQLGAIPVFIYDKPWFPYEDVINWDSFCIRIHESDIEKIKDILIEYTPFFSKMKENGKKVYRDYFSLTALPKQIYRILDAQ